LKRRARIVIRVLGWILLSIIGIFLFVFLLIQTPPGQNFARKRAVVYLQNKLHTKVEIGRLTISFPKRVVLENVFFADQRNDTLLAGKRMQVDIELFKLLSSEVIISHIGLEGIRANVYRLDPDSTYNFDYILKAFATPKKANSTDSTSLRIQLNTIALKDVITTFHDDRTGNDMFMNVGELNARIDTFNPDKQIYSIPVISAKNVTANIRQYKPLVDEKPMAVVEAESNQRKTAQLRLKDVDLSAIKFNYNNTLGNIKTDVELGKLIADVSDMNFQTMNIELAKLQLDSTKANIFFGRTAVAAKTVKQVKKEVKAEANNPWKIKIDQVSFSNNNIKYDDENVRRIPRGMDYAHLDAKNIYLDADELLFTPLRFEGKLNQLALNEKSGLVLKEARTDFIYTDNNITLSPIYIRTDNSVLRDLVVLNFT